MYIAEVAPTSIRGKLVSLNQLTIVLGILAAQITNWLIAEPIPASFSSADMAASYHCWKKATTTPWNGQMAWRWMFWAAAFPAAVFCVMACFIPESPRWLAMKNRDKKAFVTLNKIGGNSYAQAELQAVREANEKDSSQAGLKTLFSKPYRKVLLLGVVVAFFQQ